MVSAIHPNRDSSITRRAIFAQAWPIMLAQATIPLVGVVDTAVIGRTGDATALAAVALGVAIVNFLVWAFGFLRMGITGLVAQARGSGKAVEANALLARGVLLGGMLGIGLFALQWLIVPAALALMASGGALDREAAGFIHARLWGAPALLAFYSINGWLLGMRRTRHALALQLVMNGVNMVSNIALVWGLGMGVRGIGFGTAIAEWTALATGLWLTRDVWRNLPHRAAILSRPALARLLAVNRDLMIRTIALLTLFTWFTNAGARLGEAELAAQHVLMQFVSITAFVLDGFCFTAEERVGSAIGAQSRADFLRAVRLVAEWCLWAALAFTALILLAGEPLVAMLTTSEAVRAAAAPLLWFVALVPLVGLASWLLDGVFIGATEGRALRNAALFATAAYIATDLALRPLGANGVWLALLAGYAFRALALGFHWPRLLARLAPGRDGA
ncbi:MATE family efflux transporter [Altererythrobacter sp. CC-YST694]|uniref:MATE family efflux transporter n=1 Tax=Altererythrobacter sp. CC-YST694 TaxID=2755038 RepID=UPI001D02FC24|nr:MATE family efflux transporter [Altererythrobacter sp. CC-YST694]MCB5424185.1 MATE family efflux transporter [Altererythrobacter sp. CC-YST694]